MRDDMTLEEEDILRQINQAFADVGLDDGTSLNMTEYNDSGRCMPDFREKAKGDERDSWSVIPDETLEQFTVTFSFTDLKGFRFYIPAYMAWTIRNHHLSDSIIADNTVYAIDPAHYLFGEVPFADWFTKDQIAVMIRFLEYASHSENSLDVNVARDNLEKIGKAQSGSRGSLAPRPHPTGHGHQKL